MTRLLAQMGVGRVQITDGWELFPIPTFSPLRSLIRTALPHCHTQLDWDLPVRPKAKLLASACW